MVNNVIGNPLYFLTMSIAGWIIVYIFSQIIEQKLKIVAEWAVYISIHSVWIIALHFLCFKFVTAIKVTIENLPFYLIASFPILDAGRIWWLAYTIAGLVIPLLFERMEKVVLHKIKSYYSNLGGGKCS